MEEMNTTPAIMRSVSYWHRDQYESLRHSKKAADLNAAARHLAISEATWKQSESMTG